MWTGFFFTGFLLCLDLFEDWNPLLKVLFLLHGDGDVYYASSYEGTQKLLTLCPSPAPKPAMQPAWQQWCLLPCVNSHLLCWHRNFVFERLRISHLLHGSGVIMYRSLESFSIPGLGLMTSLMHKKNKCTNCTASRVAAGTLCLRGSFPEHQSHRFFHGPTSMVPHHRTGSDSIW